MADRAELGDRNLMVSYGSSAGSAAFSLRALALRALLLRGLAARPSHKERPSVPSRRPPLRGTTSRQQVLDFFCSFSAPKYSRDGTAEPNGPIVQNNVSSRTGASLRRTANRDTRTVAQRTHLHRDKGGRTSNPRRIAPTTHRKRSQPPRPSRPMRCESIALWWCRGSFA